MAIPITSTKITLISRPYAKRAGLWPMVAMLALSWIFVALWVSVAVFVFPYSPFYSVLIGASTIAFSCLLFIMSRKIYIDSFRNFALEITDTEAVLSVEDSLNHKHSQQMVLLDDVKFAEYYPFTDSASVILHAPYTDMEVPLWPMENQGHDLIDFLEGRGVNVVNVQTDDKIPD